MAMLSIHREAMDASVADFPDPDLLADLNRAHVAARAVLGCDHLAADAVQEALITLWRQEAPPPQRRAWLVRTVVHRARTLRRSLARRHRHEAHAGQCAEHADCRNPLHHALADDLQAAVRQALQALPAEQREPFLLHHHGELDYAAIAHALAVPVGTVRSRLHRARAALASAPALADFAPGR